MTIKAYYQWLKTNWSRVGPILAIYIAILLFLFVKRVDIVLFYILIHTPLYMIHQTEEYVFPGGFTKFFDRHIFKVNNGIGALDDENLIFFINIPLIWVGYFLFGLLSMIDYQIGIWIVYFSFFAGVNHIGLSLKAKKLYNAGLVVSLVLNIPISLYSMHVLKAHGVIDSYLLNTGCLIGFLLNALLPLSSPLIKRRYERKLSRQS